MLSSIKQNREVAKTFKQFAEILDIVYFGAVHDSDEYEPVKGITFTPLSSDKHLMSGNYDGFELTALLRESTIKDVNTKTSETNTYSILKITLNLPQHPHVLITSQHNPKHFFEHLHLKYPRLKNQNHLLNSLNASYVQIFKTYTSLEDARYIPTILTDLAMQALYMQFPRYEFEIVDNAMIVSFQGEASLQQLKDMLAAATWLTEHTEYVLSYQNK